VRRAAVLGRVNHRKEVLSCALSYLFGAGVVVKQLGCGKDGVELVDRGSRSTLASEK